MAVKSDTPLKWPITAIGAWAFPAFNTGTYSGNQTGYANYLSIWVSEPAGQIRMPKCRITKMRVNILSNSLNSASTLTLRRNGADTGLTGSIGAGVTGQLEFTGSEKYSDGDLLSIQFDIGGTGGQGIGVYGGSIVGEA